MSLLDKQEVQDLCEHTALHCTLENGVNLYVNERQKIRHFRARSTEERRRMPNRDFLLRAVRT